MATINPPDAGCVQMEVGGRTYSQNRKGQFEVADRHVGAMLRNGECFLPQTGLAHVNGYTCLDCGFNAVFSKCGRCGSTNMRKDGS